MADLPDFLTLRHNRDRSGFYEVPIRRAGTSLIALFCLAGLLEEEKRLRQPRACRTSRLSRR
jgi:hypothetical protein